MPLLARRNGFYAFESALHVLPSSSPAIEPADIPRWNQDALWRSAYGGLADGMLFFAEDVFGGQFAVRNKRIVTFDPESGQTTDFAENVDEWASRVLADYDYLTGYSLAHAWQAAHGPLRPGFRLVPKKPFVLGGEFTFANLYALEAERAMRLRGALAVQYRDLPDGAPVRLVVSE
jgi:hypothetical protein